MDHPLDVIKANEASEDVNGHYQFTSTLIVYRDGDDIYHGTSKARYLSPAEFRFRLEHLSQRIPIPISAYAPPLPLNFTRKPRLISYDRYHQGPQPTYIADDVLRETAVCELLRQNPHPNIAEYRGCQVSGGDKRIVGVCFAKYEQTLMQAVNPHSYGKRQFQAARQDRLQSYRHILKGVESGLRHIHKLGFAHNDINPSNIMLHGDVPIIIDFNSSQKVGESLEGVGRTYEWYDETVQSSLPENDLNALQEIRVWLFEDSTAFQFQE
ncbi:hypothetical protein F5Y17DRAFT_475681 [Xylariaceae sp. FL0594]|nr:hypothetical protein F5Y17DRAFT_475681 [Xylariaceae sp. FL0594]